MTMETHPEPSKTIWQAVAIGAGIAGVAAAQTLFAHGKSVLVLEKSRGVGGRMATRRMGEIRFDHGAQYFTARHPLVQLKVAEWTKAGLINAWAAPAEGENGEARQIAPAGMSSLPKSMAGGLTIHLNQKVTAIHRAYGCWQINTADGSRYQSQKLIATAPVPQILAMLDMGGTALEAPIEAALKRVEYHRCLAVMALLDAPSAVPAPGGFDPGVEPLIWMADNTLKGLNQGPGAITLHASPVFSLEHWETPAEEVIRLMLRAAEPWLGAKPVESQLHRWRHARPVETFDKPCLVLEAPGPLIFAGDAFGGPSVEGAYLSGCMAGWAALPGLRFR